MHTGVERIIVELPGVEWGRGKNSRVLSKGLTGENLARVAEGALALLHLAAPSATFPRQFQDRQY